ncbi:MAG: hypothetical protein D6754_00420 [Alphaproteobacteria bacterium]|nr:MAG: hypothetical protein D6754_00420 [Alphaproteobacteria bacterium]
MTGMVYLDVALGLIFTVLIFSLLASAVQEVLAGLFSWRSRALRAGVARLVGEKFGTIWKSPLIDSLRGPGFGFPAPAADSPGKRDPSYIDPKIFASALLDGLGLAGKSPAAIVEEMHRLERNGTASDIHRRLAAVLAGIEAGAAGAEAAIAQWFDAAMERVTGWYVRRAKFVLFFIGLALVGFTNTNLFAIGEQLLADEGLRARLVAEAEAVAEFDTLDEVRARMGLGATEQLGPEDLVAWSAAVKGEIAARRAALEATGVPTGWARCNAAGEPQEGGPFHCGFVDWREGIVSVLSWLAMAALVTLGAQFWFDLLKQFVAVRSAGVRALKPGSEKA